MYLLFLVISCSQHLPYFQTGYLSRLKSGTGMLAIALAPLLQTISNQSQKVLYLWCRSHGHIVTQLQYNSKRFLGYFSPGSPIFSPSCPVNHQTMSHLRTGKAAWAMFFALMTQVSPNYSCCKLALYGAKSY